MPELTHITEAESWETAVETGTYRRSTRGVSLEQQGFIHCSAPHQLRAVAEAVYGDATGRLLLGLGDDPV